MQLLPTRPRRRIRIDHLPEAVGPISALWPSPDIARVAKRVGGRRDSGQNVAETFHLSRLPGLLALESTHLAFHALHLHFELGHLLAQLAQSSLLPRSLIIQRLLIHAFLILDPLRAELE